MNTALQENMLDGRIGRAGTKLGVLNVFNVNCRCGASQRFLNTWICSVVE